MRRIIHVITVLVLLFSGISSSVGYDYDSIYGNNAISSKRLWVCKLCGESVYSSYKPIIGSCPKNFYRQHSWQEYEEKDTQSEKSKNPWAWTGLSAPAAWYGWYLYNKEREEKEKKDKAEKEEMEEVKEREKGNRVWVCKFCGDRVYSKDEPSLGGVFACVDNPMKGHVWQEKMS